jgi:hypothetical protein
MNLRRHIIPKSKDLDSKLLDPKATTLTPEMITYLEHLVPLMRDKVFDRVGFDGMITRTKLLQYVKEYRISLKIAQLELRRRKKMKNV